MVIDTFLVVSIILIAWLGWSVGFTRTFFAVIAGFFAIFIANKYPYQEGINFYLVFAITALVVILIGAFMLRIISFFYLTILDKIGGLILSVCVWLIVSLNVIIPTMTHGIYAVDKSTHTTIYKIISHILQSNIPVFKNYIPQSLEIKEVKHQK